MFATSSTVANRCSNDVGRTLRKNSFSNSSGVCLALDASLPTNSVTPSEAVGPGSTAQVFYTNLVSPTVKLTYQLSQKQKIEAYWAIPDNRAARLLSKSWSKGLLHL